MLAPLFCDQFALAPLLPKLRGHFAEFLDNSSLARLRILSSSTCVGLRYGHLGSRQRLFLAVWLQLLQYLFSFPITARDQYGGFACHTHSRLGHALPAACSALPPASPRHSIDPRRYRNLNLLSIAYSFRSQLRSRLTLSGRTFLRKPQIFGGQDSHLPLATHANILSPMQSTVAYAPASARIRCSSTNTLCIPKLRCQVSAPFIFGAESLD